jgi:hypothetical protein
MAKTSSNIGSKNIRQIEDELRQIGAGETGVRISHLRERGRRLTI